MAKRNASKSKNKRVKVVATSFVTTVPLRLIRDNILKISGPVTGKLYVFSGAGSVVDVDQQDVAGLLSKKQGDSCCTGIPGQPYFELVA